MSFSLGSFPLYQPRSSDPNAAWSDGLNLGRYSGFDGPRLQLGLSVVGPPANLASLTPAQARDLGEMLIWWSNNPWYGSESLEPPVLDSWDQDDWG